MDKKTYLIILLGILLIKPGLLFAESYNLWVKGLYTDKQTIAPGEKIKLTYQVQATAPLFGDLNFEVFIRSGPREECGPKWTVPYHEGSQMGSGTGLIKTREIHIPDWGEGTYFIDLVANKSRFFGEENYDDNHMQLRIKVEHPNKEKIGTSQHPLGQIGKFPFYKFCGNNILSIDLNRENIRPGQVLKITTSLTKISDPLPNKKIHLIMDGGLFSGHNKSDFFAITDANGVVEAEWTPPLYPENGTGHVDHTLKVLLADDSFSCEKIIPLQVTW